MPCKSSRCENNLITTPVIEASDEDVSRSDADAGEARANRPRGAADPLFPPASRTIAGPMSNRRDETEGEDAQRPACYPERGQHRRNGYDVHMAASLVDGPGGREEGHRGRGYDHGGRFCADPSLSLTATWKIPPGIMEVGAPCHGAGARNRTRRCLGARFRGFTRPRWRAARARAAEAPSA